MPAASPLYLFLPSLLLSILRLTAYDGSVSALAPGLIRRGHTRDNGAIAPTDYKDDCQ